MGKTYYCRVHKHKHYINSRVGQEHINYAGRKTDGIVWFRKGEDWKKGFATFGKTKGNNMPIRAWIIKSKIGKKYEYSITFSLWSDKDNRWLGYSSQTITFDKPNDKDIFKLLKAKAEEIKK
jgi:hypothetical protein